ncbi:MAG: hypothetical protein ACREM9_04260 [Gemmatimonadales bacterium]
MRDTLRLTVWAVLGFTPGVLAAQSDTAGRAAAVRELEAMGSLELKGAMHGPAPMVACATSNPRRAETAGHTFIPIVVNWLALHLHFFE